MKVNALLAALLAFASVNAHATMASSGIALTFDGAGSFFTMGANNPVTAAHNAMVSFNGIVVGTTQAAEGHGGELAIDPVTGEYIPEAGNIDYKWVYFNNTGAHYTSAPTNVLSASGNTAVLDMSGWMVSYSDDGTGNPIHIPMTGLAWQPVTSSGWGTSFVSGKANITCGVDCAIGDTYTLRYTSTVPAGAPFQGTKYALQLQGNVVAAVPEPETYAMMLAGLGLLGVAARRRKTA